jgi:hypothetical protein
MSRKNKRRSKKGAISDITVDRPCVYCGYSLGKQAFWNKFRNSYYSDSIFNFEAHKNIEQYEDYTNIFLSHARIHIFADKYDVANLHTLALGKLHQILDVFNIYSN